MTYDTEKDALLSALKKAVDLGAKAEIIAEILLPLLKEHKEELINKLETENYYYQKIDNINLLAINLELKVLRKISDKIQSLVSVGEEARKEIFEMNQPEKKNVQRRYRF